MQGGRTVVVRTIVVFRGDPTLYSDSANVSFIEREMSERMDVLCRRCPSIISDDRHDSLCRDIPVIPD